MLNKLTAMRTMALDSRTSENDKFKIDSDIKNSFKQLMVSVENYPELKASNNFMQLQESWTDIEDRISASRRFYNNAVVEYNIAIKSFPQNLIAKSHRKISSQNLIATPMGYKPKPIFEITVQEAENLISNDLFNN